MKREQFTFYCTVQVDYVHNGDTSPLALETAAYDFVDRINGILSTHDPEMSAQLRDPNTDDATVSPMGLEEDEDN